MPPSGIYKVKELLGGTGRFSVFIFPESCASSGIDARGGREVPLLWIFFLLFLRDTTWTLDLRKEMGIKTGTKAGASFLVFL